MWAVLLTVSLSACGFRIADFTATSTKNYNLPIEVVEKGPRVQGEDCAYNLFGIPLGHIQPSAEEATDKALEKADANFLLDTVWDIQAFWFIIGTSCVTVEGTPVKVS